MAIKVEEYLRADSSNPYKRWFDTLDAQAAAKVVTAKLRLELGNTSSIKWFAAHLSGKFQNRNSWLSEGWPSKFSVASTTS